MTADDGMYRAGGLEAATVIPFRRTYVTGNAR